MVIQRLAVVVCLVFTCSPIAIGTVSYTISGSGSSNHYGIQTHESKAVGAGIEYGVGSHVGLGLTHRQEFVNQGGHKEVQSETEDATTYKSFKAESRIISNSANVTVNLYNGQTLVPYVFVGAVQHIIYSHEVEEEEVTEFRRTTPWGPQAGLGVAVRLNKEFAVKLSYTASPGSIIADPVKPEDEKYATNSFVQIGLAYKP